MKVTKRTVKEEMPSLNWGINRLEAWWKKNGPKTEDNEGEQKPEFPSYVRMEYNTDEFPGCCAFTVIHTLAAYTDDSLPQIACATAIDLLEKSRNSFLATTIPSQKKEIAVLQAIGFQPVLETKNPNTRNIVTMWCWERPTPKRARR